MTKKIGTIEETIIEMAEKRFQRNGKCCISVRSLTRAVARKVKIVGHDEPLPRALYVVVDTILQDLGGKLWTTSRGGTPHPATNRDVRSKYSSRVYAFNKQEACASV